LIHRSGWVDVGQGLAIALRGEVEQGREVLQGSRLAEDLDVVRYAGCLDGLRNIFFGMSGRKKE
jgi:hypothetical protein